LRHLNGHLVLEAALGGRWHPQVLAEPVQIERATGEAAAGETQLALKHLEGDPELGGLGPLAIKPAPAGLQTLAVQLDSQSFLSVSEASAWGREPLAAALQGRRWRRGRRHGQAQQRQRKKGCHLVHGASSAT
jgi:hypothetical protein